MHYGAIQLETIMNFNSQEYIFLQLLRSTLWGGTPQINHESVDWDDILNLAKIQSVMGIVSRGILDYNAAHATISDKTRLKCKSIIVSNVIAYDKLDNAVIKVTDLLNSKGVSSVLLKGQGISRYYPRPQLRQCGDIDLYVGEEQYEASYHILSKNYKCVVPYSEIWEDKHYTVIDNDLTIEVHRKSDEYPIKKYDKIYQQISDKGLTDNLVDCEIKNVIIKTPSDTFNAFYIFNHMFHHFVFGGVGLRQLCDWALFLKSKCQEIDRNELMNILMSMNLLSEWQEFSYLIVNYLGCPQEVVPFYTDNVNKRKISSIMTLIFEEGNFGKNTSYYKNRSESYIINKCKSLLWHINRFTRIAVYYPSHAFHNFVDRLKISLNNLVRHR